MEVIYIFSAALNRTSRLSFLVLSLPVFWVLRGLLSLRCLFLISPSEVHLLTSSFRLPCFFLPCFLMLCLPLVSLSVQKHPFLLHPSAIHSFLYLTYSSIQHLSPLPSLHCSSTHSLLSFPIPSVPAFWLSVNCLLLHAP